MGFFWGSEHADTFTGISGFNLFFGNGGEDRFVAGNGFDLGFGGDGNDTLIAADGLNYLSGDDGSDTFGFVAESVGYTIIADWEDGNDKLDLSELGVTALSELVISQNDSGVLISANGQTIELRGQATVQTLGSDDFIFAESIDAITFEEFADAGTPNPLPYHYEGLQWDNFGIEIDRDHPASGYDAHSGTVVVFNEFGDPATISSDTSFDLESFYMSAAWSDGLEVTVTGYEDGFLTGSQTFVLEFGATQHFELNDAIFDSVDEVVFTASGGDDELRTHFALDDVLIIF